MKKILLAGAGGAPTENVVRSLIESGDERLIGMGSEPYDLMMSSVEQKYRVPYAVESNYKATLKNILQKEKPDLVHFQNDIEIREASKFRDEIENLNVKLFMPTHDVIETCVDKSKSYLVWKNSGIRVAETININSQNDLKSAFETLRKTHNAIWLRASVGGGGKGALPTDNYDFAKLWIDKYDGWGKFTASELLSKDTVTFLSIWFQGELVVAQTRRRKSWNFGNRTLSGVTGITGVGETFSNDTVTQVAMDAINTIDKRPHGIYGVDMTYSFDKYPMPTEINISRFFTTVYFFTKAGLNMPRIFADIALYNKFPVLEKKINPLSEGLLWLRGMDREPILTTETEMTNKIEGLYL